MIVKCEQCQTRFKIPDDKVTDKGVKVRCTKCQHTFRVKKDGSSSDAAGAPKADDPFDKFGPSTPPTDDGEQTRPGVFALGIEATKSPLQPSFQAQAANTPKGAFDAPTRVAKMPAAPPGRRPLTDPPPPSAAPFDFGSMKPVAPAPAPFDFGSLTPPGAQPPPFDPTPFDFNTAPPEPTVRAQHPGPPAGRAASFEPQPFDFGALSPAEPTVKAPVPAPPRPPAAQSHFEPQPFDFSALAPAEPTAAAPAAPPPRAASAGPTGFEPQPFDFSSLTIGDDGPPPPPPMRAAPPPAPSHFEPQPFDFSAGPSQPAPARPPPSAPSRPAPSKPVARPSAPPPPPPPPPPAPVDLGPAMDFGEPPPSQAATQLEVPAADDLLADVPFSEDHLSIDADSGMSAEPGSRGALFDMASPEASEPVNQLAPATEQVTVAKIALKRVTAESLAAEAAKPAVEHAASTESSRSRRPRGVVAMVWNVLSAAMLLVLVGAVAAVVLNEGKIDPSQSWGKLKSMFSTPRELVAFDISNGLYDTRAGRPVFYVRGAIKNRGHKSGRVKVKAEILDGEDLIRAAEGLAGATPSPEELYGVTTAEDLASLSAKLAPTAQQVDPGSEAPFLVAFYEYPPDLKDFRVRVTVSPDDGKTAAR